MSAFTMIESPDIINSGRSWLGDKMPEVGQKCSYRVWTDVEPCTIVEVSKSGKTVKVQMDKAVWNRAEWPAQDWQIERDENGRIYTFTLRKNGKWKLEGVKMRERGSTLSINGWRKYRDPHF